MEYNETPRTDPFTQGCRDFIRTFTYEDILACTIYAGPMVFMIGPAAIVAGGPIMSLVFYCLLGCSISGLLHRMGHRLLVTLPCDPQRIVLARSLRLPVKLRLPQFLWMLESLVGAALFCGIVGRRCLMTGTPLGIVGSLCLFTLGVALFFLPVHLGRLWIARYYPAMSLMGPSDEVIKTSFPSLRSLFKL